MPYDPKNQYAMQLLSEGQVKEADEIFCQILSQSPNDADALYGRACVARAAKQPALAIGLVGKAIEIKPEAHYYITLGLALYEQDHAVEAEAALKSATLLAPFDARGFNALAMVQEQLNYLQNAQFSYQKACELQPKNILYWVDLTRYYWRQNEYDKALQNAQLGVKKNPGEIDFLHELGSILPILGLQNEAVLILKKIIRLRPKDMLAHANLGAVYFQLGQFKLAEEHLSVAMKQDPLPIETSMNYALVKMALGNILDAHSILEQLYLENPLHVQIGMNLGSVLYELRQVQEAEKLYKDILAQYSHQQIERDHSWYQICFNLSTSLLAQGKLREGWEAMENRYALMNILQYSDVIPMWDGVQKPSCLLIKGEQGLGDMIQFMRYLPLILQQCAIVVEIPQSLVQLFSHFLQQGSHQYSWQVIGMGEVTTPQIITHQCGIMSLPFLLKSDHIPQYFLKFSQDKSDESNFRNIGLCWIGNSSYRFDEIRSMTLSKISEIVQDEDLSSLHFHSLQYGAQATHLPKNIQYHKISNDLFETAVLIESLDVIITVDTVIAHLAGAMNKKIWLLNRYGGDWRWYPSQEDKDGYNQWYPTLTIFQQNNILTPDKAWDQVIVDVKNALKDTFLTS